MTARSSTFGAPPSAGRETQAVALVHLSALLDRPGQRASLFDGAPKRASEPSGAYAALSARLFHSQATAAKITAALKAMIHSMLAYGSR
jgi:hypothetical protein